jgi:hypothetical protein
LSLGRTQTVSGSQVCPDISSSGFDVRSHSSAVSDYNFVANVIGQYIVIFAEYINGFDVLIEKVCRPRWREAVNRAIKRECEINTGVESMKLLSIISKDEANPHSINASITKCSHACIVVQG